LSRTALARLLHRHHDAVQRDGDAPRLVWYVFLLGDGQLDPVAIAAVALSDEVLHTLEARSRVGQSPRLLRRLLGLTQGALLYEVRHRPRRRWRPAVVEGARPQADDVDGRSVAIASHPIERPLEARLAGLRLVDARTAEHASMQRSAGEQRRSVDIERTQRHRVGRDFDGHASLRDQRLECHSSAGARLRAREHCSTTAFTIASSPSANSGMSHGTSTTVCFATAEPPRRRADPTRSRSSRADHAIALPSERSTSAQAVILPLSISNTS
jgi:hypothetical protein